MALHGGSLVGCVGMFGQQGACVRDVRTSTGRLYYRYARRRPSLAGSRASLLYERIPTRSLHNFPNGSYPPTTVVCCKLTKKVTRQGSEAPIYSPSACVRPQPRHGIARFLHLGLHALHSGKGNIRVQNELCNPYLSASAPQRLSAPGPVRPCSEMSRAADSAGNAP